MANKLLSDDLENKLLKDPVFQHILKFAPQSQRELMTFELARYFSALSDADDSVLHHTIESALPSNTFNNGEEPV